MSETITEQRRRRKRRQQETKKKYVTRTQHGDTWKKEEVEDFGSMEEMMKKYGTKDYIWYCAMYPPSYSKEEGIWNGYRLDGEDSALGGRRGMTRTEYSLSQYRKHKAWISNMRKVDGKRVILVANAPDISPEEEMRLIMAEVDRRGIGWSEFEPAVQTAYLMEHGSSTNVIDFLSHAPAVEVKRVVLKAIRNIIAARNRAHPDKPEEPFMIVAVPRSEMERRGAFGTRKTPTKSWVYKRREE